MEQNRDLFFALKAFAVRYWNHAKVAELADAPDLGSGG